MSIKQLIGYMMTFDQTTIDGVIGNVIDGNTNYISIEFSNEESKQQLINRLTTTNLNALMLSRSIPKQLSKYHSIRERLRFASRNPNIDKDTLDKINDDLEKYTKIITKLSEDLVKCREDITATFYLENESGFYIPAGFWFLCSDRSNLDHKGDIKCENIPGSLDGSIKLRPYQAEDVPVVLKYKRATLVYGTGLGKSVMIAAICTLAAKSKKRTIVITPSVYLAEQIYGTISKFHSSCTYAHGSKDPALGKDVLVVTAFSAKKYIQSYHVVIIDEHQHSAASTWFDLLSELDPADHVYCFTATPIREDGMDAALFAFGGPILLRKDVKWGISNGFLEHFDFFKINYTSRDSKGKAIKLKPNSQATTEYKLLVGDKKLLKVIANKVESAIKNNRKVIILFKYLTIANLFAKMFPIENKVYVADADFKKPLHDFKNNNSSILIATAKLVGEGVDIPSADVLINLLQNSSDVTTYQTLGRILRKGGLKPIVMDVVVVNSSNFKKYAEKRAKVLSELADKTTVIDI